MSSDMNKYVLETVVSPINGNLNVIQDPTYGIFISGAGLDQSGRAVEIVWRAAIKKAADSRQQVERVLILGLGGGSIAKLVRQYWPGAKIVGVDVDPVIVDLGKKYMGLGELDVDINIADAFEFISQLVTASEAWQSSGFKNEIASSQASHNDNLPLKQSKLNPKSIRKFDLICVDTYVGDQFPQKFESVEFLHFVRSVLTKSGVAVFNRLYFAEYKKDADDFGNSLKTIFTNVEVICPELNVLYICQT